MRKTGLYMNQLETFKRWLREDIKRLCAEAQRKRLKPCVRLNGTSDIDVQEVFGDILDEFSSAQFYDYSKVWNRKAYKSNYYLVYSRSETTTEKAIDKKIEEGYNVAVVFDKVPKTWRGHTVVPGDDSDLRFLDPQGVIVGLQAKSRAKSDTTGFVVQVKAPSEMVQTQVKGG